MNNYEYDVIVYDDVSGPIAPSFASQPMGGSEKGMLVIAEWLAKERMRKVLVLSRLPKSATERSSYPIGGIGPGGYVDYAQAEVDRRPRGCRTLIVHRYSNVPDFIERDRTFVMVTDMAPEASKLDRVRGLMTDRQATLLCVSDFQRSTYPAEWPAIVVPPPIPEEHYGALPGPKDPNLFVYASAAMKGLKATVDAWIEMKDHHPECDAARLVCLGGWGMAAHDVEHYLAPEVRRRLARYGIVMLGNQPPDEITKMIARAAGMFFVNTFPETFCAVAAIAEARACRMHVAEVYPGALATTVGSPLLITNLRGAPVPPIFHEAFAQAYAEPDDPRWYAKKSHAEAFRAERVLPRLSRLFHGLPEGSDHVVEPERAPLPAGAGPTVCLTMIVSNEEAVIRRCLTSVRPLIDAWCIYVNNTSDRTREIIREELAGVPGEIVEGPWEGFGATRTAAIRAAEKLGTDYLLAIDADDVYEGTLDRSLLTKDAHHVRFEDHGTSYVRAMIFRTNKGFRYEGVVHEYLTRDGEMHGDRIGEWVAGLTCKRIGGGSRGAGATKYLGDARLLEAELKKKPRDTRSAFYLAESYRHAGEKKQAIDAYMRRADLGGWIEEVYLSNLYAGRLHIELKSPEVDVVECLLAAYAAIPGRAEALWTLARYYHDANAPAEAYLYSKAGIDLDPPEGALFVEDDVYETLIHEEFMWAAGQLGRKEEVMFTRNTVLDTLEGRGVEAPQPDGPPAPRDVDPGGYLQSTEWPESFPDLWAAEAAMEKAKRAGNTALYTHVERLRDRGAAYGKGYGTNIPALAAIVAASREGAPIIELGSGHFSTLLLSSMCRATGRTLVTLDTNMAWLQGFRDVALMANGRHHLVHVPDPEKGWEAAIQRAYVLAGQPVLWGVGFVDQQPDHTRLHTARLLRGICEYLVVHDTRNPYFQGMDDYLSTFRHRYDDTSIVPCTTIVSMSQGIPLGGL